MDENINGRAKQLRRTRVKVRRTTAAWERGQVEKWILLVADAVPPGAAALTAAKLSRHFLAVTVFVHHIRLLNADAIMGQQFLKAGIQRHKDRLLSHTHSLLSGRHDFFETIQVNEQQSKMMFLTFSYLDALFQSVAEKPAVG